MILMRLDSILTYQFPLIVPVRTYDLDAVGFHIDISNSFHVDLIIDNSFHWLFDYQYSVPIVWSFCISRLN